MISAFDKIKAEFLTEVELANFLGVAPERVRDLRSNFKQGKTAFIAPYSVSAKCHLYNVADVLDYIKTKKSSFGCNSNDPNARIQTTDS